MMLSALEVASLRNSVALRINSTAVPKTNTKIEADNKIMGIVPRRKNGFLVGSGANIHRRQNNTHKTPAQWSCAGQQQYTYGNHTPICAIHDLYQGIGYFLCYGENFDRG